MLQLLVAVLPIMPLDRPDILLLLLFVFVDESDLE